MKPLNRAERNNAFLSFLLLFLITMTVIIAVTFLSIEVPCKESKQLRTELFDMNDEKELLHLFNEAMKKTMNELNRFEEPRENVNAIKQDVQYKIDEMNKLIKDVPGVDTSIYPLVIRSLVDLNDAKAKIRKREDEKN